MSLAKDTLRTVLASKFPAELVEKCLHYYSEAKKEAFKAEWRSAQSNVGLFCEAAARMCRHSVTGSYTPLSDSSFKLETEVNKTTSAPKGKDEDESLRDLVPRAVKLAYTFRNKRGVDHLSQLEPNHIDATVDMSLADWILAELVRVSAAHDTDEIQALIDALVERQAPILEKIDGDWRILDHLMPLDEMILLVKYFDSEAVQADLVRITRAKQPTVSRMIDRLDSEAFLHKRDRQIFITAKGQRRVEDRLRGTSSFLARGA